MRAFILKTSEKTIRVEFADEEYGLYSSSCRGDVEAHNSLNPGDPWEWGEAGTASDPTLTEEQRKALAGQAEIDRINAMSAENQALELEGRLDGLASEADSRDRKSKIRGQTFDAQAWFQEESAKIIPLYTKI